MKRKFGFLSLATGILSSMPMFGQGQGPPMSPTRGGTMKAAITAAILIAIALVTSVTTSAQTLRSVKAEGSVTGSSIAGITS